MSEDDKKKCIKGVLITRYVKSAKDCGRCLSGCQSVCVCVCVCPIKHLNLVASTNITHLLLLLTSLSSHFKLDKLVYIL